MSRPNYRVLLSYDSERKVYSARVPELPPCTGEGATRSEALLNMERELDALLSNLGEHGGRIPAAIDELPASGELTVKVSRSLARDLAFHARIEGVELDQLASEILAAGLQHRERTGRPQRRGQPSGGPGDEPSRRSERSIGNERGERGEHEGRGDYEGRWRGERNSAARFHGLLEDRASFMEYVRGLEAEGGHGVPGQGRGGPQRSYGPGRSERGGRRGPPGQGPRGDRGPRGERPPRERGPGQRPGPSGERGGDGGASGGSGPSSSGAPSA